MFNIFTKNIIEIQQRKISNMNVQLLNLKKRLLNDNRTLNQKKEFVSNNLIKIDKIYRWSVVVDQYEAYFKNIIGETNQQ